MTKMWVLAVILTVSLAAAGSAQAPPQAGGTETGLAAVYTRALNGRPTASGQVYDPTKLTAAHKTLPFGTTVRVTNPKNNKSVILRINDRGSRQASHLIGISAAAAARLGIDPRVTREVTVEVVALGTGRALPQTSGRSARTSSARSETPGNQPDREVSPPNAEVLQAAAPASSLADTGGGPADAVAGQCYAKVIIPARFEARSEQVVKVPASKRLEVVAPTYRTETEQVLVSPEYTRSVPVPATYKTVTETVVVVPAGTRTEPVRGTFKTVTEQVEVTPARSRIEIVPATYKSVTEQVVVRPERKELKTIPATYKTIQETVLDRPASTVAVAVPATFKTVTEQVMVRPEATRYEPIAIPVRTVTEDAVRTDATNRIETSASTFKTATERVMVKEAGKRLVEVPAVFATVTERVKVAEASTQWKRGRAWIGQAREVRPVKGFVLDPGGKTSGGKPVEAKPRRSTKGSLDDDVMCLVEVPARYRVVTRKVLKTPASVREVEVPAEYATVTRQVVDAEASSRSVAVPATYQKVTRTLIDVETLRARGYKFDENGDIVATPDGNRVLRAAEIAGAAGAARTSGAASGEEAYVREITVPAEYPDRHPAGARPACDRAHGAGGCHAQDRHPARRRCSRADRRGDDPGGAPHGDAEGDRHAGELARGPDSGRLSIGDASGGGHSAVHPGDSGPGRDADAHPSCDRCSGAYAGGNRPGGLQDPDATGGGNASQHTRGRRAGGVPDEFDHREGWRAVGRVAFHSVRDQRHAGQASGNPAGAPGRRLQPGPDRWRDPGADDEGDQRLPGRQGIGGGLLPQSRDGEVAGRVAELREAFSVCT